MFFRLWLEHLQQDFFHGSPINFNEFSYDFLGRGKGYDQEGPGFYFTSSLKDVKHYGGTIYKVSLNLNKTVPLKGKVKLKEVKWMLEQSPVLKEKLEDWDEDPTRAFNLALSTIAKTTPHDAFQSVWYDFYLGYEKNYLTNMKKMGYEGIIIPRGEVTHVVMFAPQDIKIIEKII